MMSNRVLLKPSHNGGDDGGGEVSVSKGVSKPFVEFHLKLQRVRSKLKDIQGCMDVVHEGIEATQERLIQVVLQSNGSVRERVQSTDTSHEANGSA